MHPLLHRQLRKLGLTEGASLSAEQWGSFLQRVSHTYEEADRDRYTFERCLTMSSREMQQLYEALRVSEANFKVLVERLPDCVFVHQNVMLRYVNPAMARLLGYDTPEELCAQSSLESFVHPDDRAMLRDFEARNEDSAAWLNLRWMRRDGTCVTVAATRNAISYDDEPAFMVIARDITAKLRAENEVEQAVSALRLSEDRYRILFEHSPLSITLFDPSTLCIAEVNATALQLYGYSREELLTMTMADLKMPDEMPELVAGMARVQLSAAARAAPGPWRGTRKYRRKDGTCVDVETTSHPVTMAGRTFMLAIGNDVTEARRLEERVRQAQKMDAIGNLAGGVAHDFNNLLSVILSYADILLSELKPEDPTRVDLEEIREAGHRAAALTRQLLAFGRQEVWQPAVVDLNGVLATLDKMLRRLIGEDIEIVATTAPQLAHIRADLGQIEQVIMNLAVNARDAMPDGGKLAIATANISLTADDVVKHVGLMPGPYVTLSVTDEGVGMDRATQARMFEPFFTTKQMGKGTGLGLATVFGIVKQSGGAISVETEPGKGTSLTVYIPAIDRRSEAPQDSSPPTARPPRGSETILLVEDEERVRIVARTILGRCGYNILEAMNAGEALLLCEQFQGTINLLLTDVVMPRMGGRQLADRLRSLRPDMKVLYMSGYADDAVVRHGVLESTVAFLQKPITPASLSAKVREVLGSGNAVAST